MLVWHTRVDAPKTIANFDGTMRSAYEAILAERPIRAISDADARRLGDLLKRMPPNALNTKAVEGTSIAQLAVENQPGAVSRIHHAGWAQKQAIEWLWTYNNERPNMGIGSITPAMKLKTAA